MAGISSSEDSKTARAENGIMTRFYNAMYSFESEVKNDLLKSVQREYYQL